MFRDDHRAKLDAILAKYAPTKQQKVERAVSLAYDLIAQLDLGMCRADDAGFSESDHPRDKSGKFTKGAGTSGAVSHGITSYEKTLKKGAKGSVAGLMKHLLATGDYSENDIFHAAAAIYDLPADKKGYVKWYAKDMAKVGNAPPPMPSKSKVGGDEAPKPPAASGPAPTAAATPSVASPAASKPAKEEKTLKQKAQSYLPAQAYADLLPVFEHMDKLTPENKPKVETKLKEMFNAVAENEGNPEAIKAAVGKIEPIAGIGQSVGAVNQALLKTKILLGATPAAAASPSSAPAYTPSTPAQVKAFDKLKKVPHFRQDHVNYFEDADGKELKAVLKTDTKKIPGEHYALVTSAYAGKKGEGNTTAVGQAMDAYRAATAHVYSPDEQKASSAYKGSIYDPMNDYLLGKTSEANTPDYIKKYVKDFREAVNKSVVPADTPAYRGLRCSLKSLSGFDDPEQSVGRCFEHANFASVSRRRETSENFAGKGSAGKKVLMKMTIPAGSTGMVLGEQGTYTEAEIVLPDKCTFRIDQVEPWDNGKGHFIHVTYLGVRTDD